MRSLRIAMAVRHFRPVGGQEKITLALVAFLAARGHAVTVYAFDGEPVPGVTLHILPKPSAARPWRDWATGNALARALRFAEADVTWGEQKTWDVNVLRPGGGSEEEYWLNYFRFHATGAHAAALRHLSPKRHFDLRAEARGYANPQLRAVIANSQLVERHLLKHYPHLAGRIVVVRNGVDRVLELRASPDERRAKLTEVGLRPEARTLLFAGHDFQRKGLGPALVALARVRKEIDAQLIVAGRDRAFRARANELGVAKAVAFVGGDQPLSAWLPVSDALLFPTYFDSFGFVITESLGAGVPVITTRAAGGSEILTHGRDGWIADDAENVASLAEGILALTDPARSTAFRSAALATARNNSAPHCLAEIEAVLQRVSA